MLINKKTFVFLSNIHTYIYNKYTNYRIKIGHNFVPYYFIHDFVFVLCHSYGTNKNKLYYLHEFEFISFVLFFWYFLPKYYFNIEHNSVLEPNTQLLGTNKFMGNGGIRML